MSESVLSANNETLHALLNNAELLIWSVNHEYAVEAFNECFRNFVNETVGQDCHPGMNFLKLLEMHAGLVSVAEWQANLNRVFKGDIVTQTHRVINKRFLVHIHPIFSNGMITSAAVYASDVTEQEQAREKIHQNEVNLSAIINHTPLYIWSVDREYHLVAFNKKMDEFIQKTFGLAVKIGDIGLAGFHKTEFAEVSKRWKNRYDKVLKGKSIDKIESRRGIIFRFSLTPIMDGNSVSGVSVFAENITKKIRKDRTLEDANRKVAQFKLMALRSVMNPHFIFNSLTSIQYLILENDSQKALNYISKFSKLARSILENSVRSNIRLSEELMQLEYYVDLEKLRFKTPFMYTVTIDPSVDPDEVKTPSLLLQPFVENAIQHGLYHKSGPATLKISVKKESDEILFEIEDNGVGRKASKEIKALHDQKNNSMGMMLTEERLKLINKNSHVSVKVTDLMENDVATGTRVNIRLKE